MSESTDQPPFDAAAMEIVRAGARRLVGRAGLRRQDQEDLEHDLLCALEWGWRRFDAGKGRWTTYARVVVDRAAKGLVRKLLAAKRGLGRTVPLHELPVELREALGTGGGRQAEARLDLALDVAEALSRLSAGERALAERLRSRTVGETAKQAGLPRSTVAGRARRLRRRFEQLGPQESEESSSSS